MDEALWNAIARVERRHWWFAGRREVVARVRSGPRPWAPLTRRRRLLWVVCAAPVGLVVALALAAFPDVGLTQWVGRVTAAATACSRRRGWASPACRCWPA